MRPIAPRGFRDVLPREAAERAAVVARVQAAFDGWGYEPVETPVVEQVETLERAAGSLTGTAFRLLDVDGVLLALRPDTTIPIARVAVTRLESTARPLRLRYSAEAFREHESLRGQPRQFTQLGIELIGASGPVADAEVVAVLAEALSACGLKDFTIALGTVAVMNGILAGCGAPEEWCRAVIRALHDRNLVELDRLASMELLSPSVAEAIREVPRIRGGAQAIERCREYARASGCEGAIDELATTWDLLGRAVEPDRLLVDFGVMRAFDYYSGLVVEAYAPEVGVPLGGGGRYDDVLGVFGAPEPAAGFALGLERLMIALAEQGADIEVSAAPRRMGVSDGLATEAFEEAIRLRGQGVRIALEFEDGGTSAGSRGGAR